MMTKIRPGERVIVSIGMPVYNGMPYLPKTLESILGQTFDGLEIVICDNASTDETRTVCEQYAARDRRIRYVLNSENIGASANYNRVFELARGEFFKWAAADDLLAPTLLERCIVALEANQDAVLAFPDTVIIDDRGKAAHRVADEIQVACNDPVARVLEIWSTLRECNAVFGLMRRDILAQTALIGCYIAADSNLLAELAMHGPFARVSEPLFYRREHGASSSADKSVRAQLQFYDPRLGSRFVMSAWRGLQSDMRAIRRAPLNAAQRRALFKMLLRRAYWSKAKLTSELVVRARQSLGLADSV